jgi:hypothetical protein
MDNFGAKLDYMNPRTSPPMYPCGHCKTLIPRARALRQAGYCDLCEWMTTSDVRQYLMVGPNTPRNWTKQGRIRQAKLNGQPLYHRADIELMRAQWIQEKRGWVGLVGAVWV